MFQLMYPQVISHGIQENCLVCYLGGEENEDEENNEEEIEEEDAAYLTFLSK